MSEFMKPVPPMFYTICYTKYDSLSQLHGLLFMVRRSYFETSLKSKDKVEDSDGVEKTEYHYLISPRKFKWTKKNSHKVLENSEPEAGGYCIKIFDPNTDTLRTKISYSSTHLWKGTAYYNDNHPDRPAVLLEPVSDGSTISMWTYNFGQSRYNKRELFICPLRNGTAEQSLINSIVGEPAICAATNQGDYCFYTKQEREKHDTIMQELKSGKRSLNPSWTVPSEQPDQPETQPQSELNLDFLFNPDTEKQIQPDLELVQEQPTPEPEPVQEPPTPEPEPAQEKSALEPELVTEPEIMQELESEEPDLGLEWNPDMLYQPETDSQDEPQPVQEPESPQPELEPAQEQPAPEPVTEPEIMQELESEEPDLGLEWNPDMLYQPETDSQDELQPVQEPESPQPELEPAQEQPAPEPVTEPEIMQELESEEPDLGLEWNPDMLYQPETDSQDELQPVQEPESPQPELEPAQEQPAPEPVTEPEIMQELESEEPDLGLEWNPDMQFHPEIELEPDWSIFRLENSGSNNGDMAEQSYAADHELFHVDADPEPEPTPTKYTVAMKGMDGSLIHNEELLGINEPEWAAAEPEEQPAPQELQPAQPETAQTDASLKPQLLQSELVQADALQDEDNPFEYIKAAKRIVISEQESYLYFGKVIEGLRQGRGRTQMQNGMTAYEGDYRDDKRDGFGTYYYKSGKICYAGEWKDNQRDGVGISFQAGDSSMHVGRWEKDKPVGTGSIFDSEGNLRYAGRIENGAKQGVGIAYHAEDGSVFVGKWRDNIPTGEGSAFDSEGNLIYTGMWKNGLRHGQGTEYAPDGRIIFSGEWHDDAYYKGTFYTYKEPSENE